MKLDITSGTLAGLGSGVVAIRPSGMAPQPSGLTVTPNAGTADADFVISTEKWQYAVALIGTGGETSYIASTDATVQVRRKKVAVAFASVPKDLTIRLYRSRPGTDGFTEFTDKVTTADTTSITDDGTQSWTRYQERPKENGVVAKSYAAIKKGEDFVCEKRKLADNTWQIVLRVKNEERNPLQLIDLANVANQATWTNDEAGATKAVTDILSW